MSTATTEGGLQVSCAKPNCHWKGPPADAPAHDCPTPRADVTPPAPFAGITGQNGEPIADELADTDLPYHVIWTSADGEKLVRVGTAATEAGGLELAQMTDPGKGSVEVKHIGPAGEELPEIDADYEPTTRGDVAAWLAAHGNYDENGVPQDEKTASLDARLDAFEQEEGPTDVPQDGEAQETETEPEPEVEPIAAEAEPLTHDAQAETASGSATSDEAAEVRWETLVAMQLQAQGHVAAYRWLVVNPVAGEIVGRAKIKREIEELLANVAKQTPDLPVQIVKTQDVLDKAEELQIERKRQMVPPDEPAQTPAAEPTPDTTPDTDPAEEAATEPVEPEKADTTSDKGLKPVKPDTAEGKVEKPLFDASDFDREDLALPKVDGHGLARIAVDFSGTVMLDRGNPDHVALFRRLKLGAKVELWVEAKGLGFAGKGATNKDGDLDVVVGRRSVTVNAIRIVPPEGLADLSDEMKAQARDAHEAGEDSLT